MEDPLGEHYIIELWGCKAPVLDDLEGIRNTLLDAADRAGATIVENAFHKFAPQGVSGVVVIAESHLSIHTWPELGYAALDLFTCNLEMDLEPSFVLLREVFQPEDMHVKRIARGLRKPQNLQADAPAPAS